MHVLGLDDISVFSFILTWKAHTFVAETPPFTEKLHIALLRGSENMIWYYLMCLSL